ncbi:T9SS type A sorting domain-containing protein [bacterium]|nr:T9SS type A sorting domain-containing protein [bacterium]
MKFPYLILFLVTACLPLVVRGQSATFELVAQNDDFGFAEAIAELPDSSICLATDRGLHIYALTDSGFVLRHLQRSGSAYGLAVTLDGMVFAARGGDGLYAYSYDGSTLQPADSLQSGNNYVNVAVAGSDTLVATGTRALYALHWDGNSIAVLDSVSFPRPIDGLAIAPGGDVILAGAYLDTVRAFRVLAGLLIETASLYLGKGVVAVTADAAGNVYFGDRTEGFRVCRYDGASFIPGKQVSHGFIRCLAAKDSLLFVGGDGRLGAYRVRGDTCEAVASALQFSGRGPGRIFVGSGNRVYTSWYHSGMEAHGISHDSLVFVDRVNDGGYASAVVEGEGGVFFLANGGGGLRAYRRNGSKLTSVAHINDGGSGNDLAVGDDGTLYLANDRDGIRAYTFDANGFSCTGHYRDSIGSCDHILWEPGGTIFTCDAMQGFRAFARAGEQFIQRAAAHSLDIGVEDMAVSGGGTIFLADGGRGLLAYDFEGDSLVNQATEAVQYAMGVAVGLENTSYADVTVFAADRMGLSAYDYDGKGFTLLAHDEDIHASKVRVDTQGTVFVSADGQVRAYGFDGNTFRLLAAYDLPCWNIALGDSGIVYAMHTQLTVLRYRQSTTGTYNAIPERAYLLKNYPNPFSTSTSISFTLAKAQRVTLVVNDLYGREVRRLLDGCVQEAGHHQVPFRAMDLPAGFYFYRLTSEGRDYLGRMVLLR